MKPRPWISVSSSHEESGENINLITTTNLGIVGGAGTIHCSKDNSKEPQVCLVKLMNT